jgi:polyhydroxybutyrate depolymerase
MVPLSSRVAGDYNGKIWFGGRWRTYYFHVPASYKRTNPTALVLVFHGGGGTGRRAATLTRCSQLSDQQGFIVVYPNGLDHHWNDGRGTTPPEQQGVDDVGFVSALLEHLAQTLNIDPKRVYATGISNGTIFTQRLGCELSNKIAAIGPVAGTLAEKLALGCAPQQLVSVVEMHGTEDPRVPYNGGQVQSDYDGRVLSVRETVTHWVALDGCGPSPQTTLEPNRDPNDGTRVLRETYSSCQNGSEVVLYAIEGGGHTWPGQPASLSHPTDGRICRDIDATEVIWDFFAQHPKEE